jgi:hypothetical protein
MRRSRSTDAPDPAPGNAGKNVMESDATRSDRSAEKRPTDRGEVSWLSAIVDLIESEPQECAQALEGLATVETDLRLAIIGELAEIGTRPGARALLRLLTSDDAAATRAAASAALQRIGDDKRRLTLPPEAPARSEEQPHHDLDTAEAKAAPDVLLPALNSADGPRLIRSLVTPVDGLGRGTVVVSVSRKNERLTAAFLCDVQRGIGDVMGEVEPESDQAGGLIHALNQYPEADCARDVPELALGLLAGSLLLSGSAVSAPVRQWLLDTLGPAFLPAGFPASIPGIDFATIPQAQMPNRAAAVLEACPSWLDLSPLTFELAEEIWLREGRATVDPERDAGAYRFLFEHRLIDRLELYRRMLSWMAWLWKCLGAIDLSSSALALAWQLADLQYAVPSHPFTVELTTRSFMAAQDRLGSDADPRSSRRL